MNISVSDCPHTEVPNTSIPKSNIAGRIQSARTTERNAAEQASSTTANFALSTVYDTAFLYAAASTNLLNGAGTSPECARTHRMLSSSSHEDATSLAPRRASKTITGTVMAYFMSFFIISKTIAGFALPLEAFITGPMSAFIAFSLPALNWSTAFWLPFIASMQNDSSSELSLFCRSPFSDMMSAGGLPVANISANTSLPICLEISPPSIISASPAMSSGDTLESNSPSPRPESAEPAPENSPDRRGTQLHAE